MNKKAEQQILLVRSRTIPTTDRVKICSQFRIHRLFTFCACSSWSWPGVLGCLECIRWGTGWPPDTRRNWSSWRSRSPCTCSSGGRGSPWCSARRRTGRRAARECSPQCRERGCTRRCTSRCRSWRLLSGSGLRPEAGGFLPRDRRRVGNTWKEEGKTT